MQQRRLFLLFSLAFLIAPAVASANTGTPFMFATSLHLFIANLFIGIFEGYIVARIFSVPRGRAKSIFILANYVSAWVGLVALRGLCIVLDWVVPGSIPLYKAPTLISLMWIVAFLFTILLEWPFCAWALGRTKGRFWRSLCASVIAQTCSYALLVPYYLVASNTNIYRNTDLQRDLAFVKPPIATVHYLNPEDNALWRIRTDGTGKTKVLDTSVPRGWTRLFLRRNETNQKWDLWKATGDRDKERLLSNIAPAPANTEDLEFASSRAIGRPVDLRAEKPQGEYIFVEYWAGLGISVRRGKDYYDLGFETPFMQWSSRNGTILPNNQMVYQLDNQIVIFDLSSHKLGLLTLGQGPVVTLD